MALVNFQSVGISYFWHCCKVSDEAAFCLIQRP
ncbi:short-chain dehydrogenase, partial [Klebsiella pneumoniae]